MLTTDVTVAYERVIFAYVKCVKCTGYECLRTRAHHCLRLEVIIIDKNEESIQKKYIEIKLFEKYSF